MVHVTTGLMLKRIQLEGNDFITRAKLLSYCKDYKIDYDDAIAYYLRKEYFLRIFRGIFYVKTPEELKLGRQRYNHLELMAKGMSMKGVNAWYYGLHTALKLNNMTHEYFNVEDVISTKLLRITPVSVSKHKFKFTKISAPLYGFGILERRSKIEDIKLRYSNPEKTILDFVYLWRYRGNTDERIVSDLADWSTLVNKKKMLSYSNKYPSSIRRIVEKME